jgi:hypothetical protein
MKNPLHKDDGRMTKRSSRQIRSAEPLLEHCNDVGIQLACGDVNRNLFIGNLRAAVDL